MVLKERNMILQTNLQLADELAPPTAEERYPIITTNMEYRIIKCDNLQLFINFRHLNIYIILIVVIDLLLLLLIHTSCIASDLTDSPH